MNGHYIMRVKLWAAVAGKKPQLTPDEARTIEALWFAEERTHHLRWRY